MGILEELKISIFLPQQYYRLKGESIIKLLRFDLLLTILGVLYLTLIKLILSLITNNFSIFLNYYSQLSPIYIVLSLLYLFIGLVVSSVVLSFIFYVVGTLKKIKDLSFYDLIVYATHTLTICIIFESFFGPLVIALSIGYFLISTGGEKYITYYVAKKIKGGRKNGKRV